MPYDDDDAGDVGFATQLANDQTRPMSSRAGTTISEQDAIKELRARRASPAGTPSQSTSLTPQAASSDDAEKAAFNELRQRRPTSQGAEASLGADTFTNRFDAAPEMEPSAMAKQMIAQKGFAGAVTPFFQSQLQRLVREHPDATTGAAIGMNLPLIAAATYYGGRYGIPFAMRNLGRIGLGGLGIEQLYQHVPQLLKLIKSP